MTQTIDGVLGETVNYQYDYLHRLTAATATNGSWGDAYSYDGFGNLTAKTPTVGSAPTFSGSAGSNAQNGSLPGQWDVENRPMTQGSIFYVYDPWGRRIFKQWSGFNGVNECEAYFYGAAGQKLESYSCEYQPNTILNSTTLQGINTYFGGKMLSEKGVFVATDRLGSVRATSSGDNLSYFPWGEERGTGTADGRTKFAGYYRDQPGQDYANARYYSATTGSFWSPDPGGMKAANSGNPTTWNRYAYVAGDPINAIDPRGTDLMYIAQPGAQDCTDDPSQDGCWDPCQPNPYADGLLDAPDPSCYAAPVGGGGPGDDEPDPFVCPAQYQAWINTHGADAIATGLSEANVLALSSIESGWGNGRFAKQGNSFFNLEGFWKPGTARPSTKYAYQSGWIQANEMITQGPLKGYYALVASYSSASDSFKSFAATLGSFFSGVTDPTKFGGIAVAHGINAGKGQNYADTANTFINCLAAQNQ